MMNPSSPNSCPQCGEALLAGFNGLCPTCLALVGFGAGLSASETVQAEPGGEPSPKRKPVLSPTLRYFGDYQLIEEIARGGMGVVHKARQVRLNRVVAVKMILSGKLATEADVKRFHTEAEAAANLRHPNIVAIHEVGEHEGHHYFSMDYVEGKNLAEVARESPMPAGKAAALIKTLAEAVHHAHQRGTLHRDLKPSNVLIDTEGQPHITDFGLAKQMSRDSELTQTGAVLGTPAYMPPEQASGRHEQVGPASDVYSLGAMLYHLLTGRAPCVGGTPAATLNKVMEEEPVALSKLNPRTPPDLETICLKCLEKPTERRYHSARELAEELGRFLNHEPILAKPASASRKVWSWLSKHPWFLVGAATFAGLGLLGFAYGLWEQVQYVEWKANHPAQQFSGPRLSRWWNEDAWATLFFTGIALLLFKWSQDVRGQRMNLPITRLQTSLGVISGLFFLVAGLAGTQNGIADYVWLGNHLQYLGVIMIHGFIPCLFGALTLLQPFRSRRTTHIGDAPEEESQFLPVFHGPVIMNPGVTALGWCVLFVAFGVVAYFAMPMGRYPELKGAWAGPASASMLVWLRVLFFTGEVATAIYVAAFRTLLVRKAPVWMLTVGCLVLGGDLLCKVFFLPGTSGTESWLAGLAGGLVMARICRMRRAEAADIAAAKLLANEEERRLTAQFGSRTLRVSVLWAVVALMILAALTDFRNQWVWSLAVIGLSAIQPPLFMAWLATHKIRLALVLVLIFGWIFLPGGFQDLTRMNTLAPLAVGYAAGFVLLLAARLRKHH